MPTRKSITASLIAVALPFTASAYFKYIPAPPEIPEPVSAPAAPAATPATPVPLADSGKCDECDIQRTLVRGDGMRALGAPSSLPKIVNIGGIDRFSVAVEEIAPPGWTIENRIPVGMDNRAVEWSAGRPWPQTMDGIAQQAGRSVLVDWGAQSIVIE